MQARKCSHRQYLRDQRSPFSFSGCWRRPLSQSLPRISIDINHLRVLGAQDLYGMWEDIGSEWVGTGSHDSAAPVRDSPEAAPELSPQQLQLVQQHFDRVRGLSPPAHTPHRALRSLPQLLGRGAGPLCHEGKAMLP